MEKILVLDFGGQYNQLIARRVRDHGVFAEILPYTTSLDTIRQGNYKGIIFTGGPNSVYDPASPHYTQEVLELGVPVLGICYGCQLLAHNLGGRVVAATEDSAREYGKTETYFNTDCKLFRGLPAESITWMSHGDYMEKVPEGFSLVAHSEACPNVAICDESRGFYGVQFHPEVNHTQHGTDMIRNFLYEVCGAKGEWTMGDYKDIAIRQIREKVGDGKVLLALSGGVDSSVAAKLMLDAGYDCMGATMKLFDSDDILMAQREKTCCSLSDVEDARSVARRLGMPYQVFNFKGDFKEKVIDKFIATYEAGGTPNPCIDCNKCLKFDTLCRRAITLGYDYVVTGHYARIDCVDGRYRLRKALDDKKDQSYVLYNLSQEQLAHTLFPLGELHKDQVRAIAEENGFINAHKRESQDICFVPDGDYAAFIESYTGRHYPPGDFVDTQGNVLGRHKGIIRYTIGQRRGLGLALPAPLYVCKKDPESNTVTLCPNDQLNSTVVRVTEFNWLSIAAPAEPLHAAAKIRYNMHQAPCTVEVLPGGDVQLTFDAPQRAVTPGQAAVIYDGDTVLGGGRIV